MISINSSGNTLQLSTLQEITSSKKCTLRITYTDKLQQIVSTNEAKINTLTDLDLESVSFQAKDQSKLFLNSKSKAISITLFNNAKAEINCKGQKTALKLTNEASVKALIASNDVSLEMDQKSEAKVEGDCTNLQLVLDNATQCNGKNLTALNADISLSASANALVLVKSNLDLSLSGKAELDLYGEPKIQIKKLTDSVILRKKPLK